MKLLILLVECVVASTDACRKICDMPASDNSNVVSNAFKPILEAAEAADALSSDDEGDQHVKGNGIHGNGEGDEYEAGEHPVEEIESLCMQCHGDVC